jgi:ATP-dependent Clp protease ATP-binding subunit ClpC
MFERYTEKARRVIFFSRYEASQFGAPYIETEHILLGLLRESPQLLAGLFSAEQIRKEIQDATIIREKTSVSVDLPLSNEAKRVLAYAAEEAESLGHRHIGSEHLLLGMLREEQCFAAELLRKHGVSLGAMRDKIGKDAGQSGMGVGGGFASSTISSRRVVPKLSEFVNDQDGSQIASVPYALVNLPAVGDEVVIEGSRFRVSRVVHHFNKDSEEAGVIPEKIEIRVVPLAP